MNKMINHDAVQSESVNSQANGHLPAMIGGLWGLMSAFIMGGLRVAQSATPQLQAEWIGDVAFLAVYLAPFVLALLALRWKKPAHQAFAWSTGGILAVLATATAFSGVSLVFLPAGFLLAGAALPALRRVGRDQTLPILLVTITLVALGIGAWQALIADDSGRCWALTRSSDGTENWESVPFDDSMRVSVAGTGRVSTTCTTDIISPEEGVMSLSLLAAGGILLAVLLARWRA